VEGVPVPLSDPDAFMAFVWSLERRIIPPILLAAGDRARTASHVLKVIVRVSVRPVRA